MHADTRARMHSVAHTYTRTLPRRPHGYKLRFLSLLNECSEDCDIGRDVAFLRGLGVARRPQIQPTQNDTVCAERDEDTRQSSGIPDSAILTPSVGFSY